MNSGKNGVAAFPHSVEVGQLVFKPKLQEGFNNANELAETLGAHTTVKLATFVPNADDHGVSASKVVGVFRQHGQNFCVVGAQVFSFDELRFQGVFSGADAGEIAYVLKYLRRCVEKVAA